MLSYGLVGGGIGSFIADVHIRGIEATRSAKLVAGCFSRKADNNKKTGEMYGLNPARVYTTYDEMAKAEAEKKDGIDFVVITTPNASHYVCAKTFLNNGIHVACDKPLTVTEEEAYELKALAAQKGLLFCVTFTYGGYPILNYAKEVIARGDLGKIVMVMGEYAQDWLAGNTGIAPWRTKSASAGQTCCLGDIGSHVHYTVNFLTGLEVDSVCCKLDHVGGHELDTNASVMIQFDNGASGVYWTSQIAHGNDNGIRIRIYGEKGSIEWKNEDAEVFNLTLDGYPTMRISKGRAYSPLEYSNAGRLPAGHHEGLYYAFANIYQDFINAIDNLNAGKDYEVNYPSIIEGCKGMHYLTSCIKSNKQKEWVKL